MSETLIRVRNPKSRCIYVSGAKHWFQVERMNGQRRQHRAFTIGKELLLF